jgi:hypothetical protein
VVGEFKVLNILKKSKTNKEKRIQLGTARKKRIRIKKKVRKDC